MKTTQHTSFGDCSCDSCFPPEKVYPLANHGKRLGLLQSLWIVLKGLRFYD